MFIPALFLIAKNWQQPKHPLTAEWINKLWHTHTVEHDTTIKERINYQYAQHR